MEFQLLPSQYEEIQNRNRKKYPALPEDYFGFIIICACILICLVGVVFVPIKIVRDGGVASKALAVILGILAGIIGGGIAGFISGGLLASVLYPIVYPIYRAVANAKDKKEDAKCQEEIEKYRNRFEIEAKKLSAKFKDNVAVNKAVDYIVPSYINFIENANRASHVEKIDLCVQVYVQEDGFIAHKYSDEDIGASGDSSYFRDFHLSYKEERLAEIEDGLTIKALAIAVASQIKEKIMDSYEKDESGTEYKIELTYKYPDSVYSGNFVVALINYVAKNANFKDVQKW